MSKRNDSYRLAELRRLLVLDSSPERATDDLVRSMSNTLGVPIVMLNMLDADRDWFKACLGLNVTESPAATSFCEVFFDSDDDVIVVPDTTLDYRFCNHPLVTGAPFIRFYAATRLTVNREFVGTLCAYDLEPRQVSEDQMVKIRWLSEAAVELLKNRAHSAPSA